ncbi:MAG TPA: hypothetical protein PK843_07065 [bacterium]|nr:hypothetical protein [bacterium]HPN34254.1 hypothetical protein [bacterium]
MSYPVRNTLIIAAVWAFFLGLGYYYVFGVQRAAERKLAAEVEIKKERVNDLQALQSDKTRLEQEYARLEELHSGKKGVLASHETPGETYDYIHRELIRIGSSLEVNLTLEKTDDFASLQRRQYEVFGKGRFHELYHLIWFFENGPLFYNIQSLKVQRQDQASQNQRALKGEVQFSLRVCGYNRPGGPEINGISREDGGLQPVAELVTNRIIRMTAEPAKSEPMRREEYKTAENAGRERLPSRAPTAPVNTAGLPDIASGSSVLAVTANSALIKDSRGRIVRVRAGDRVHLGQVLEINAKTGQVVFELADSGRPTLITLSTQKN